AATLEGKAPVKPASVGAVIGDKLSLLDIGGCIDALANDVAEFVGAEFKSRSGNPFAESIQEVGQVAIALEVGKLDALGVVAVGLDDEIVFLDGAKNGALIVGLSGGKRWSEEYPPYCSPAKKSFPNVHAGRNL